jgi:hypothetical protein
MAEMQPTNPSLEELRDLIGKPTDENIHPEENGLSSPITFDKEGELDLNALRSNLGK